MAKGPTPFSVLVTLLDVGERARPLVLTEPTRAVKIVAPVVADAYGPELAALTPDQWTNLETFLRGLMVELQRRSARP